MANWTDCPIVEVNPRKQGGAPLILGTRAPVSAILNNHASGSSDEEIADNFGIPANNAKIILSFALRVKNAVRVP